MKITDKQIKAGAALLGLLMLVAAAVAFLPGTFGKNVADASTTAVCADGKTMTLSEARTQLNKGGITISIAIDGTNLQAIATVVNKTSCAFPGSFADYQMYDQKLSTQVYYAGTSTKTIAPNSTSVFTIKLPSCMAQTDFYYGDVWKTLYDDNRNGNYTLAYKFYQNNGNFYNNASGNFCKPPAPKECKLQISKSVDKTSAAPGDTVTYTINFKNIGTANCTGGGVRVQDSFDSRISYISGSATQSGDVTQGYDSNIPFYNSSTHTLSWNANVLTPGESGTVTWKGKVNDPISCGTYTVPNTAKITSYEYAGNTLNSANPSAWVTSNTVNTSVTKQCTPDLVVSCSANPSSLKIGDTATFTANVSGGNGAYSYSWTGTDGLSGSSRIASKSYSTEGGKSATVTVTSDGQSRSATCSTSVYKQQNPALHVSCSVNSSQVRRGDTVTYTAYASGGDGSYDYSWTGDEGLSSNSSSASKSYSFDGGKSGTVTVTSDGQSASATCSTNVYTPSDNSLYGSCSVDDDDVQVGDTVTWRASASGGSGNYTYDWSGDNGLNSSNRTVSKSYSSSGVKDATVVIRDSNGRSVTSTCSVNIRKQEEDLEVSCSASPRDADINEKVTWKANASGGGGNYDYDWSGDDGLDGDDRTETMRYDSAGTKDGRVRVTSDDGESETAHCSVDVNGSNPDVTIFTNTDNNNVSAVFLSQIPYTGPMDNLKMTLYVLGFLLWSGAVSFYILRRKYGKEALAVVSAKAGALKGEFTDKIASLRNLRSKPFTVESQAAERAAAKRDEMLKKLWDRVNG
jgi:uncharacterized repeat protein (TIGR01451 family)